MVQTIIFNASDIETARMAVDTKGIMEKMKSAAANFSLFTLHFSLKGIYRKQLRAYCRMAQVIDRHGIISNLWIGGWSAAGIVAVFLFA